MGGKGKLVKYTSIFKQGPLTPDDKKDLKEKIDTIIKDASGSITIQAMVAPSDDELKEEIKNRGG